LFLRTWARRAGYQTVGEGYYGCHLSGSNRPWRLCISMKVQTPLASVACVLPDPPHAPRWRPRRRHDPPRRPPSRVVVPSDVLLLSLYGLESDPVPAGGAAADVLVLPSRRFGAGRRQPRLSLVASPDRRPLRLLPLCHYNLRHCRRLFLSPHILLVSAPPPTHHVTPAPILQPTRGGVFPIALPSRPPHRSRTPR